MNDDPRVLVIGEPSPATAIRDLVTTHYHGVTVLDRVPDTHLYDPFCWPRDSLLEPLTPEQIAALVAPPERTDRAARRGDRAAHRTWRGRKGER